MTEIIENNMLHLSFEGNHIVSAEIQHEEELDSQQVVEICEEKKWMFQSSIGWSRI